MVCEAINTQSQSEIQILPQRSLNSEYCIDGITEKPRLSALYRFPGRAQVFLRETMPVTSAVLLMRSGEPARNGQEAPGVVPTTHVGLQEQAELA